MEKGDVIKWREPYGPSVRRRWAQFKDWLALLPRQLLRASLIGIAVVIPVVALYVRDVYQIWPEAPSPWAMFERAEPVDRLEQLIVALVFIAWFSVIGLATLFWPGRIVALGRYVSVDGNRSPSAAFRHVRVECDDAGTRWLILTRALQRHRSSSIRIAVAPSVDAGALRGWIEDFSQRTSGAQVGSMREPRFANIPIRWRTRLLPCGAIALVMLATLVVVLRLISASQGLWHCLTCTLLLSGMILTLAAGYVSIAIRRRTATVFERAVHISDLDGGLGWIDRATIGDLRRILDIDYRNRRGRRRRTRFALPKDALNEDLRRAFHALNDQAEEP